jgi:hypothetical protein
VRCEYCGRVRHGEGRYWFDHPAKFASEITGACATCMAERRESAEKAYWREFRAALKRKATGRARGAVSDPFQGFRE